ncbi:MAG: holo-[acyl-carrier-protein] synthase [Acidobacteria bacterium]|nr:holo-[acyl-carrier-protein] synthase [Acidobacteriota bacterium]
MIAGVGIDLVAVARVTRLLNRHGQRFVDRCFSPDEIVRGQDPEHLAGLLAAKEAAFKALAAPTPSGIGWRSLAILHAPGSGRPALVFRGRAREVAEKRHIVQAHLSISHQAGTAVAVVILEAGSA